MNKTVNEYLIQSLGFPLWLSGKESACQGRRHRFEPWVRKTLWEGNGILLQYSCLENPMDRGASWATVHGLQRVRHNLATEHVCMVYSPYDQGYQIFLWHFLQKISDLCTGHLEKCEERAKPTCWWQAYVLIALLSLIITVSTKYLRTKESGIPYWRVGYKQGAVP